MVLPSLLEKDDYFGKFQTITLANGDKVSIMMMEIESKYVCGNIQDVCLNNCVKNAIMGCEYVLNGESAPDPLDSICVRMHKQAVTETNACEMHSETEIISNVCKNDTELSPTKSIICGVRHQKVAVDSVMAEQVILPDW